MGFPKLQPGQILIGSENLRSPVAAYLQAGSGINIQSKAKSITIACTSATFEWTVVKSETFSLQVNKGYLLEWDGTVTLSIPLSARIGDEIKILSKTSSWEILPKQNQEIILNNSTIKEPKKIFTTNTPSFAHLICVSLPATYMISTFMGSIQKQ